MATLCLDLEFEGRARCDLHPWLDGHWALLFSHPEDFQYRGRGRRSWLDDLSYELRASAVRALAVKRDPGLPEPSWIDEMEPARELVRLREPPFAAADASSFAARVLRGELLTLQSRFVLIVDASLKRRETLKYSTGRSNLSAADLPDRRLTLSLRPGEPTGHHSCARRRS
jgi:alkyl hydroperoxide reductase subunit AhpC